MAVIFVQVYGPIFLLANASVYALELDVPDAITDTVLVGTQLLEEQKPTELFWKETLIVVVGFDDDEELCDMREGGREPHPSSSYSVLKVMSLVFLFCKIENVYIRMIEGRTADILQHSGTSRSRRLAEKQLHLRPET